MTFSTLREKDRDLVVFRKIWKKLTVSEKINLSIALHDPENCSRLCQGHKCPRNPCAEVLRLTAPREIPPPVHCPICQIMLLSKEFSGAAPIGWNPTNPLQVYNLQRKKMSLLFIDDPETDALR